MADREYERSTFEAMKAAVIQASPAHRFLFERESGLLEHLWETAYLAGQTSQRIPAWNTFEKTRLKYHSMPGLYAESFSAGYDAGYADATEALLTALPEVLANHVLDMNRRDMWAWGVSTCTCGWECRGPTAWTEHIAAKLREATT